MKKNKIISVAYLMLIGFLLAGCAGLSKMKNEYGNIKYKVDPEVLETHVNMVDIKITVNIPPGYFNKNVIAVATPVLKFANGEKSFPSKTLQGEKVQGNNTVVPFETGKIINYTGSIPFEEAMRISDLEIRMTISKGEKSLDFDDYKIAEGVIATATLVQNTPQGILGNDNFQRIIPETQLADLHYLINSPKVRWSETQAEDISNFKKYISDVKKAENKKLKNFEIAAYASPDGAEDFNERLAYKRKSSSMEFLKREMKRARVNEFANEKFIKTQVTPEDWSGFKKLMHESDIQDKELILRVLSMYSDPEVREREIKNISAAYTAIAKEILPKLRRAKFAVNVDVIGKTDEELKHLALNNPSDLNIEELLFAASLLESRSDKELAYQAAKRQFPEDWRGFNNSGVILLAMNKLDDAKADFEKANQLSTDNPTVQNNLGAIALLNNNIDEAEVMFGAALGAGNEVNYNLGIVAIKKGDYQAASKHFAQSKTANAALANILTGNYNAALEKLNASTSDNALVYYLKAVVGAKTNNNNLVFTNLRMAVNKDASLKMAAKTDMEFAKLFENTTFMSIVE